MISLNYYFEDRGDTSKVPMSVQICPHFRDNICIPTMHRNVCLCRTTQSLTQVCLVNGPSWLPFIAFLKLYYLSYDFETVLATCTRLWKICILLYR